MLVLTSSEYNSTNNMAASFDEKIAEAVRRFPVLYDKSCKYFKDNNTKKNAWEYVAKIAGLSSGMFKLQKRKAVIQTLPTYCNSFYLLRNPAKYRSVSVSLSAALIASLILVFILVIRGPTKLSKCSKRSGVMRIYLNGVKFAFVIFPKYTNSRNLNVWIWL